VSFNKLKLVFATMTAMVWSSGLALEGEHSSAGYINDLDNISELKAFMDGAVEAYLRSSHSPGATVSIVKDGQVIFAKGYGFADFEKQIPVNAQTTLFRIASISKIFTATAIMQLVEQGKLDLDTDVNSYLTDFKVKKNFPGPITLRHLMTHSAGFEESKIDQVIVDYQEGDHVNSILEDLNTHFPKQVRAPGTYSSYSNNGIALMGRIIEVASGQPFHDYIEQHILQPMGMFNTTSRQPVPGDIKDNMSV